jgi:hypothetical protein
MKRANIFSCPYREKERDRDNSREGGESNNNIGCTCRFYSQAHLIQHLQTVHKERTEETTFTALGLPKIVKKPIHHISTTAATSAAGSLSLSVGGSSVAVSSSSATTVAGKSCVCLINYFYLSVYFNI